MIQQQHSPFKSSNKSTDCRSTVPIFNLASSILMTIFSCPPVVLTANRCEFSSSWLCFRYWFCFSCCFCFTGSATGSASAGSATGSASTAGSATGFSSAMLVLPLLQLLVLVLDQTILRPCIFTKCQN